ncbi:MAG: putative helicase, family [Myxococcaceae bacterium]|nr:putative helicase, family [Myxococcaceae bacterium]
MSPEERGLYDDVTRYLLEPGIVAFAGNQRQLLLLGFHRLMASSTRALALSLSRVAVRLRRMLATKGTDDTTSEALRNFANDLEDPELAEPVELNSSDANHVGHSPEAIRADLARIEGYVHRAEALGNHDSKLRALLRAFTFVTERAKQGLGAGKMVIFTESLVTQEYLRARLLESRLLADADITLFRGTNDSARAKEALTRWRNETPQGEGTKPSPDNAMRLALVHEFKTSSKVLISTEAGAKGLNLQFCDTVVN